MTRVIQFWDPGTHGPPRARAQVGSTAVALRPYSVEQGKPTTVTTASGWYGIVPDACPHRRASLTYGVVEENGIRCPYHGWLFGLDGECLEQPAEQDETNFPDRVRAQAGAAQELGGLVWAYVGPMPAPELSGRSARRRA